MRGLAIMIIDQSIARVRAYREMTGMTIPAFARLARMNESTIRSMDLQSWNPTKDTLLKLESVIPATFKPKKGDK